ncbi:SUKH-4 family immunity protein [Streptomyces sp. NPDC088115]|uniref:SUKH-4 family immunity protein n=1 Tax=Streptomyces sp. NPDC088115 TaxID=3365824 RepID=UPI00383052D5
MIFELSRDELIHTFGEDRVHQAPSDTARAAGFSGDALTFLTTIGLPDSEFISVPRLNAEGFGFRAVPVGELSSTWNLPAAAANWVFLGNFEVSAVVVDTRSGELHQLAEGVMRPIPLHRDLSSLVHTMTRLTRIVASLPEDYEDGEELIEALTESLDTFRNEIRSKDPRPFGDEHSEWVEIITDIGAGIWGLGQ